VHVDRTGKVLKRYVPEGLDLQGTDYPVVKPLPAIYGKRKINRGFEGIALSTDEKTLYIRVLRERSPVFLSGFKSGLCKRVLVFDIPSEKVTAEFAYRFEVSTRIRPGPQKYARRNEAFRRGRA
jgi:hypothetical protein